MLKATSQIFQPWRREAPSLTARLGRGGKPPAASHGVRGEAGQQLFQKYLSQHTGSGSMDSHATSLSDMLEGKAGSAGASMGHLPGLEDRRHLAGLHPGSASPGRSNGHGFGHASSHGADGHLAKALRVGTAVKDSRRSAMLSGKAHVTPEERHQQLTKQAEKWVGQTFYGPVLKQMRNSPFKSKLFDGGRGGEAFSSLYDQHLIDRMSRGAGGKLVKSLVRRIEGKGALANISHGARQPTPMGLPPAVRSRRGAASVAQVSNLPH